MSEFASKIHNKASIPLEITSKKMFRLFAARKESRAEKRSANNRSNSQWGLKKSKMQIQFENKQVKCPKTQVKSIKKQVFR